MIDTPTRRAVLGAGVFAAGSLLGIDGSLAQAPLPPTPACHDGDEATLRQTEGPFFKPTSPERAELLEAGMAGPPNQPGGFVAPPPPQTPPARVRGFLVHVRKSLAGQFVALALRPPTFCSR